MRSDIIVIGGGASGLMAAYSAAKSFIDRGSDASVTVLEKMPRAARKLMITGKGRCNFTNVKDWNEFSGHVCSGSALLRPAFFNLPPRDVVDFFESAGVRTVVERGDRAFPASYRASDIVDALVNACLGCGVRIEYSCEVAGLDRADGGGFILSSTDGRRYSCRRLVIATGGLSYPSTGSTGSGYTWARGFGHSIVPTFPSLTALVPKGYKAYSGRDTHIDRELPLSDVGRLLEGIQLRNVAVRLLIQGVEAGNGFGELFFTDGGIEGPVGFQLSRKAVKALVNGSRVALEMDLKSGIERGELAGRIAALKADIGKDPRSRRLKEKEINRILLGKLIPWELIPGFRACNPGLYDPASIADALKAWHFDIAGYVGYERAVVTAGGVPAAEVIPKSLESRICEGLFFCGEILDIDCDTGGYNLQSAFCTGALAGRSAAIKQ